MYMHTFPWTVSVSWPWTPSVDAPSVQPLAWRRGRAGVWTLWMTPTRCELRDSHWYGSGDFADPAVDGVGRAQSPRARAPTLVELYAL